MLCRQANGRICAIVDQLLDAVRCNRNRLAVSGYISAHVGVVGRFNVSSLLEHLNMLVLHGRIHGECIFVCIQLQCSAISQQCVF
jgi:hypothetical protein